MQGGLGHITPFYSPYGRRKTPYRHLHQTYPLRSYLWYPPFLIPRPLATYMGGNGGSKAPWTTKPHRGHSPTARYPLIVPKIGLEVAPSRGEGGYGPSRLPWGAWLCTPPWGEGGSGPISQNRGGLVCNPLWGEGGYDTHKLFWGSVVQTLRGGLDPSGDTWGGLSVTPLGWGGGLGPL